MINRIAAGVPDRRSNKNTKHTMLQQRIYTLALGYEDFSVYDSLLNDAAVQTTVGSDLNLVSHPPL